MEPMRVRGLLANSVASRTVGPARPGDADTIPEGADHTLTEKSTSYREFSAVIRHFVRKVAPMCPASRSVPYRTPAFSGPSTPEMLSLRPAPIPDIDRGTPAAIVADCVCGEAATLRSAAMSAPVRAAPVIGHGTRVVRRERQRAEPRAPRAGKGGSHPEVEVGRLLLRLDRLLVHGLARNLPLAPVAAVDFTVPLSGILTGSLASGAPIPRFSVATPAGFALAPVLALMLATDSVT